MHQEQGSTTDDLKGMVLMGATWYRQDTFAQWLCVASVCDYPWDFLRVQGFTELLSELRQGYSDGKSDMEIIEPHLLAVY